MKCKGSVKAVFSGSTLGPFFGSLVRFVGFPVHRWPSGLSAFLWPPVRLLTATQSPILHCLPFSWAGCSFFRSIRCKALSRSWQRGAALPFFQCLAWSMGDKLGSPYTCGGGPSQGALQSPLGGSICLIIKIIYRLYKDYGGGGF